MLSKTRRSILGSPPGAAALDPLRFGECRPHLEPNRATGQAYKGGVDRGHFSVCVDKKGTLFSFTTCPPCQPAGYGVRGYWLDEWLAAGKLTRAVYPYWAAKVHTGFARRLGDVRAVERWESEQEVLRESRLRAQLRVPYGHRPTSAGLRLRTSARAKEGVAWRKSLTRTA